MVSVLRTTLPTLLVLVALLAVACGDSGEDAAPDPTPEPTVAPTPEPTPIPQVTAPAADAQAGAAAMTFDVPEFTTETTGMEVAEALLSQEELDCVQSSLGPEASAALLSSNVLVPEAAGATGVFGECLSQENSVTVFLAGMQAATGGALSESTLNCIGNGVAPHHAVLFTEELDPAVMFALLPCLQPEEIAALQTLAPQAP